MRPRVVPTVHSNSATAILPIVTVVGSASVAGSGVAVSEGWIASVIRCAPNAFTTIPCDHSARGFQSTAMSSAVSVDEGPCHSRRLIRTSDNSDPLAPSIASRPSLRAIMTRAASVTARSLAMNVTPAAPTSITSAISIQSQRVMRDFRARGAGLSRAFVSGCSFIALEGKPDREMEPHLVRIAAVRYVQAERSQRRANPHTGSVAHREVEIGQFVGCIAGIDERCEAPRLADPPDQLRAAHRIIAAADG